MTAASQQPENKSWDSCSGIHSGDQMAPLQSFPGGSSSSEAPAGETPHGWQVPRLGLTLAI